MSTDALTLSPDQLSQLAAALARELEGRSGNPDTGALSDNGIADDVADGLRARRKGKRMKTIDGPFPHGKRFRIRIRTKGVRGQQWQSFATEDEAKVELRKLRRDEARNSGDTVTETLEEYGEVLAAKGNKPKSIESTMWKVGALLAPVKDQPLATIGRGEQLYKTFMKGKSVDTHRNALAEVKTFFRWAVKEGKCKMSPFAEVEGFGTRRKGEKEQLTRDELTRYVVAGMKIVRTTKSERTRWRAAMAVMQGTFGTRPTELTLRVVRDVDNGGQSLLIPRGKTKKAKRSFAIPPFLQPVVAGLTRGRRSDEQLFPKADRHTMRAAVRMVCKVANVPVISPYGLRGTYASVTEEEGRAPEAIMLAMGHENFSTTRASYIKPEVLFAAEQKRFADTMGATFDRALEKAGLGTTEPDFVVPAVPVNEPSI